MPNQLNDILKRALNREKTARKQAEKILESKSLELFETTLELKKVNEKLEILLDEKTTQLKGVFANINDAYIVANLDGIILSSNKAANKLSEYNLAKENIHLSKLIYKEDYFSSLKIFQELKEKGVFNAYETRIVTKSKTVKWTHINATLVYDHSQNKPIAIQCFIKDITESKLTAAIIQEQKQELEVIVDNSSLGIILTRFDKILKSNHAIQRILGYSENELLDKTLDNISSEDHSTENHSLFSQTDQTNPVNSHISIRKYKKKDGTILWAKTNINTVTHNDGETKYQVVIIEDITIQREKTILLNLINSIAKSILGKMDLHEIAWVITNKIANYLNSDDCIIYLVNYEKNTIEQISAIGNKIAKNYKIKNRMVASIGEGIVGTVATTGVGEIIADTSKDERYIIDDKKRLSEIAVPIINNGNVIAVIDSEHADKNHYTTEHFKTLSNIANLVSMQLNSAINLRERQKVEANNLNILTELSKSNTELQEYAHIVSHDLKSPLRSIHALTSWIKEDNQDNLDELSLQNFDLIEVTLEKMEQLITGILNYSSIGAKDENLESVDLNTVISDLQTILFIPDHISIILKNKLPVLKGESIKFQQLFQNLISNAIKFNNKEIGLIEIDVTDKVSYYQFSVKDNGIGINEKYFDKIFKIFHSLTDNKESTGVGLSIVKKIVDLYNGEIWVESTEDINTTFHFTIKK